MHKAALIAGTAPFAKAAEAVTLTKALENVSSVAATVMEIISANEFLFSLFAASLLFTGVGLVKAVKGAAKR